MRITLLLMIALLAAACSRRETVPEQGRAPEQGQVPDTAQVQEPVREPDSPAVEEPDTIPPNSKTLVTLIPPVHGDTLRFRLAAPRDHAIYLDNCGGAFAWGLERRIVGKWKPAWSAIINECHSAPIEIRPGSSRVLEGIVNPQPGEHMEQDTYRVVIYGLYTAHDQENHMKNPQVPLDMRVSAPFVFGSRSGR